MSEATARRSIQPFSPKEAEQGAVFFPNKDTDKKRYIYKRQNETQIVIDLTSIFCVTSAAAMFVRIYKEFPIKWPWNLNPYKV